MQEAERKRMEARGIADDQAAISATPAPEPTASTAQR